MLRLDGLRRAPFFDESAYSEATLDTYKGLRRPYERAADAAGFDPLSAPSDWIVDFFVREGTRSVTQARRQLPAVAHLFRINGKEQCFPYDVVSDLLRETSSVAVDPLGARLGAVQFPRRLRRRARAFAGKVNDRTLEMYSLVAQGWEVYARRYSIDSKRPTTMQLLGFLAAYARSHLYSSVSNLLTALSSYFRAMGTEDATRHRQVREFMAVLKRDHAQKTRYRPLFADDLRLMVETLDDDELGVRDHNILLLNYYGAFFGAELRRIDNDVLVRVDGVVVCIDGRRVFIGGVDDPGLDVRVWMRRWLDILGPEPRPLFPGRVEPNDWSQVAISVITICKIVRDAARSANINVPYPTLALRKGFAIRSTRGNGPVQTAKHMRLRRTTSLSTHVRLDPHDHRTARTPFERIPPPEVSQ